MKYKLTDETKIWRGRTVHRIQAMDDFTLIDGTEIHTGDMGGWIEKEKNLSQSYDCWIYDNAVVCDNAVVEGDAVVYDNAVVYGNAEIYDNALVYGNAEIHDNALVHGNAEVYDNAEVYGNAEVYDNAEVYGNAEVYDKIMTTLIHTKSTYKRSN